MSRCLLIAVSVLAASAISLLPAWGDAPQKVAEIASIEELTTEITAKVTLLQGQLANAETYAQTLDKKEVPQAAGVIACMAQAIVEHPDKAKASLHAADLRDAAMALRDAKTFETATKAFAVVQEAHRGKSSGTSKPAHEWNKLTGLGRMMEELNQRGATLRRGLRRLSKPEDTARDAAVMAVLSLAMEADTHEVKDQSQLPLWKDLSGKYRQEMLNVAKAVRAKDAAKASEHFSAANEACNKCHELIRDKDK